MTRYLLCFLLFPVLINAQSVHPKLEFELAYSGFSSPLDMSHAGDGSGRLFVAEKSGRVRIIDSNGSTLSSPFLNISDKVFNSGERGLLGMAFHPDYANNGYLFLHYSDDNGDTQVSRFTVNSNDPNLIDTSTEESIITVVQPRSNHNGGSIEFGPDGYLYIALGDSGGGGDPDNAAQNPQSLLGKMLRLDVNNGLPYSIPANNPFVNVDTIRNEIWAIGLRNPFRFSFDSQTGDMWIGDVGQNMWEEVNFQPASSPGGENYGWRCYEGNNVFNTDGCEDMSQYVGPVFEYQHINCGCSFTGGMVYRGSNPCLQGLYIGADINRHTVYTVKSDGQGGWTSDTQLPAQGRSFAAFAEDENHELYAVSIGGSIYLIKGEDEIIMGDPVASGEYYSSGTITLDGNVGQNSSVSLTSAKSVTIAEEVEVKQTGTLTSQIACSN